MGEVETVLASALAGPLRVSDSTHCTFDFIGGKRQDDAFNLAYEPFCVLQRIGRRPFDFNGEFQRITVVEENEAHLTGDGTSSNGHGDGKRERQVTVANCFTENPAVPSPCLPEPQGVSTGLFGVRSRPTEIGDV